MPSSITGNKKMKINAWRSRKNVLSSIAVRASPTRRADGGAGRVLMVDVGAVVVIGWLPLAR
jgi:hypothetical protein